MPPKSAIHEHFKKIDKSTAECKRCFKRIKTSGNTSNLQKHFATHDKSSEDVSGSSTSDATSLNTYTSVSAELQTVTTSSSNVLQLFKNIDSHADGGGRHSALTNAIVQFICEDNLPFCTVEGSGFRKLLKTSSPLYKVPCRKTIKGKMLEKYQYHKDLIKSTLGNIQHSSITFDIWTETMSCRSFLGLTCHYISDSKLISLNICTKELAERHKSDYISACVKEILTDWNIHLDNVSAVVTDNGSNVVAAVNSTFGANKHIPCFAHVINLVAEKSLENAELKTLIEKVRTVVKFVKSSVVVNDELRKKQVQSGIPEGKIKKLLLDVQTRWNSLYFMLKRYLELSGLIAEVLFSNAKAPILPTAGEREIIKQIVRTLRPLEHITTEASGDSYVTISKIIPMINCAMNEYNNMSTDEPLSDLLRKEILLQLAKRFGCIEHSLIPAIATILDPRFKNLHFLEPLAFSRAMGVIRKNMETSDEQSMSSESEEEPEEYDFWSHHKKLSHNPNKRSCPTDNMDELAHYIKSPVSDLQSNPLETWSQMKLMYPKLYQLAQQYLCIVGTSVPAERLFSKAGSIISQKRNRLSGKVVDKILFLNSVFNKSEL